MGIVNPFPLTCIHTFLMPTVWETENERSHLLVDTEELRKKPSKSRNVLVLVLLMIYLIATAGTTS